MSKYIYDNELMWFVLTYFLEGDDDHAFVSNTGGTELKIAKTEEDVDGEITHREFEFGGDTWICTKTEMTKLSDDGTIPDHTRVEGKVILTQKDGTRHPQITLTIDVGSGH